MLILLKVSKYIKVKYESYHELQSEVEGDAKQMI